MKRYLAALGFALAIVLQSASALAYWQVGYMPAYEFQPTAARKILKVHVEYQAGRVWFIAYFISNNEVITLSELDKPDIAAIRKVLDDAFAQGKTLTHVEDRAQTARVANWYDINEVAAPITWYDIKSGDIIVLRIK
jgi:hypothetical protein